jgi:hypothetical protein
MSDISELPLKRPRLTFVDDPEALDDVNSNDLVFELEHDMKSINNIHIFEALSILSTVLRDIIKLQSDRLLFEKFRTELLLKYGIDPNAVPVQESASDVNILNFDSTESVNDELKLNRQDSNDDEMSDFGGASDVPDDSVNYIVRDEDEDFLFKQLNKTILNKTLSNNFEELDNFEPTIPLKLPQEVFDSNHNVVVDDDDADDNDTSTRDEIDIKYAHNRTSFGQNELRESFSEEKSTPSPEPEIIDIKTLVENTDLIPVKNPISDCCIDRSKNEIFKRRSAYQTDQLLKSFNLVDVPSLSIDDFLMRIKKYSSSISTTVYIHSAFLMFKLCVVLDIVPLTLHNVHRFILASIRCSTKKLEDVYQKQKPFATVGGVTLRELFKIEVGFLYLCKFKLVIGENILNEFLTKDFVDLRKFISQHFPDSKKI